MANFTPIPEGEIPANSSTFNTPMGELDAALGAMASVPTTNKNAAGAIAELYTGFLALAGGATVSNAQLIAWAEAGAFQMTTIAYHGTYTSTISLANVLWPDGATGVYTSTAFEASIEAVNSYTITHSASSKTVTQPAVTRNASGAITVKPALTIT